MGLFDRFKKKPKTTGSGPAAPAGETLSLEALLQKAVADPAWRPAFYEGLLTRELVVITQHTGLPEGSRTLEQDTQVGILSFPDGKIPVFTATDRIFDKGIIKEQVPYLQLKGRDLFTLAKGATFLLNPYSDYGKELLPDEIGRMLDGTLMDGGKQTITVEQRTEVLIGQPAVYPSALVRSLTALFAEHAAVKAAYLAWIHNPEDGLPPHYIFGIEGEGDLQSLTDEAGFIAQQLPGWGEIVDFIRIDDQGGLSDYFLKETKPFYQKG